MNTKHVVICLFDGYSVIQAENPHTMLANSTCTLIKTKAGKNILIDTMTPWDGGKILQGLRENNLQPEDISFVISTHGHSDHIGDNNLFLQAKHIVGQSISIGDAYELHDFKDSYKIEDSIEVISTKGHTPDMNNFSRNIQGGVPQVSREMPAVREVTVDGQTCTVTGNGELIRCPHFASD